MSGALRLSLAAAVVAGAAGCGEAPFGSTREELRICPQTTVEGIDVYAGNGAIDWAQVKASGRVFAFIKATQGDYDVQSTFDANWSGARGVGIVRSAYHFFDPTIDGVAQATWFLDHVGPLDPADLPPMLDVECPTSSDPGMASPNCEYTGNSGWVAPATLDARIHAWLDTVEAATGRKPIVYSYNYWFQDAGVDSSRLLDYPLFIAALDGVCYSVGLGNAFTSALFFQYDWAGSVPGISTNCDLDRFAGGLDDLFAFATGVVSPSQVTGNDAIALVNDARDGSTQVLVRSTNGEILYAIATGSGDAWSAPAAIGTNANCGFAAAFSLSPTGYAWAFAPTANGSTETASAPGGVWVAMQDSGGPQGGPFHLSTLAWRDASVDVFGLSADGALWHRGWDASTGTWSAWSSLGGTFVTGAGAVLGGDGHGEIFATDALGGVWHASSSGVAGAWTAWAPLGGSIASRPIPVRWSSGEIEVFARGIDDRLYHTGSAPAWGPWTALSVGTAIQGEPSATVNPPGNAGVPGPEVWARDENGKVVHLAWSGTGWGDLAPLGEQAAAGDPLGWIRGDGRAEVFVVDPDGRLVRTLRDPTAGWSPWTAIATGGTLRLDPCNGTPEGAPVVFQIGCSCRAAGGARAGSAGWAIFLALAALVVLSHRPRYDLCRVGQRYAEACHFGPLRGRRGAGQGRPG